jgi:hypothetical protein
MRLTAGRAAIGPTLADREAAADWADAAGRAGGDRADAARRAAAGNWPTRPVAGRPLSDYIGVRHWLVISAA